MARAEPINVSGYFEKMRSERKKEDALLEKKRHEVQKQQELMEESYALLITQTESLKKREEELRERETAFLQGSKETEESKGFRPKDTDNWMLERQQLIEESRKTADRFRDMLQAEQQKNKELIQNIRELKLTVDKLRAEKAKLMRMMI